MSPPRRDQWQLKSVKLVGRGDNPDYCFLEATVWNPANPRKTVSIAWKTEDLREFLIRTQTFLEGSDSAIFSGQTDEPSQIQ